MKRANDDQADNKSLIKLEGVEGLWYEQPDMLSKYKRRPDTLERIVQSHFAKMIRTGGKFNSTDGSKENGPDKDTFEDESEEDDIDYSDLTGFDLNKCKGTILEQEAKAGMLVCVSQTTIKWKKDLHKIF